MTWVRNIAGLKFWCLVIWTAISVAGVVDAHADPIVSEETLPEFQMALDAATLAAGGVMPGSDISLEFQSAGGEDVGTELINGTIVDATFFPAVLRASGARGSCTASLLGPSAAMLAAHCFSSEIALIDFKISGRTFRGLCEAAPGFADFRSDDWALCILERSVSNITFEALNLTAIPVAGTTVLLTGYGCTFDGETPAVRPLRTGRSVISNRSGSGGDRSYIFVKSDPSAGQAILCPGDSGGAVFVVFGSTGSDSRMIVGVNSRTRISEGLGLISATASQAGATFVKDWVMRHDQKICGHNPAPQQKCMWRTQ